MNASPITYSHAHEDTLRKALIDMQLLDLSVTDLPVPVGHATGVAGKSCVYFVFIPSGTTGINLVAKFDDTDRAAKEWAAIDRISRVNAPLAAMLPCRLNRQDHGVIIYRDANGVTASGKVIDFAALLYEQLATTPSNCILALELALSPLEQFYRGTIKTSTEGRILSWREAFPKLSNRNRLNNINELKRLHWPCVSTLFPSCPDPLPSIDILTKILEDTVGKVMVSQAHGDLNLHNILFGMNGQRVPVETFIIDLANFREEAITATEFARIESEFWHESFAALVSNKHKETMLRSMKVIRDCLEGRAELLVTKTPEEIGTWQLLKELRKKARSVLGAGRPDYQFVDFMTALYLSHLNALGFESVNTDPIKLRVALLGASLSKQFRDDWIAGRYGREGMVMLKCGSGEDDRFSLFIEITVHCNLNDIRNLCLKLGIDFEGISGGTKDAKVRELILKCERQGRSKDLLQVWNDFVQAGYKFY